VSALLQLLLALGLDRLLGEPARWHPLVGFGKCAGYIERHLYADTRLAGSLAMLLLLLPAVWLASLLQAMPGAWLINALLLYLALGGQSLRLHAERVAMALRENDLPQARDQLARLVSRETRTLNEQQIASAAVESVLENGNDAIFGAIFWFMIAGAPGVVGYRMVNTLDAMWGYRNERYLNFGWAAARLDDVLNYVPARLTALSYALAGRFSAAMRCWKAQGSRWKSPNAGPVMAAGAGSLGVMLGGAAVYHGQLQARPQLGEGASADQNSIEAALFLVQRAVWIWGAAIAVWAMLSSLF